MAGEGQDGARRDFRITYVQNSRTDCNLNAVPPSACAALQPGQGRAGNLVHEEAPEQNNVGMTRGAHRISDARGKDYISRRRSAACAGKRVFLVEGLVGGAVSVGCPSGMRPSDDGEAGASSLYARWLPEAVPAEWRTAMWHRLTMPLVHGAERGG